MLTSNLEGLVAGPAPAGSGKAAFVAAACFRSHVELPAVFDGDKRMTDLSASNGNQPLVSIVILNYKRRDALIQSLGSALSQEYPNLEIILVDNGSEDGIRDYVTDHAP